MRAQPGDIFGFSSCSLMGAGINLGTWGLPFWGLSHVGIVANNPASNGRILFEATKSCELPCILQEKHVEGVQAHSIRRRIAAYNGKVWLYRLKKPLTPVESVRLTDWCVSYLGTSYDLIAAFRARRTPLGWLERRFSPENLMALYCAEFVAAGRRHVDRFATGNASGWNPNSLCRATLRRAVSRRPVRRK